VKTLIVLGLAAALSLGLAVGCTKTDDIAGPATEATGASDPELRDLLAQPIPAAFQSPPPGVVTVAAGAQSLTFWPYTGENFSGTPQDPINLVFIGHADPRDIREALFALDGNRTAFGMPDEAPYNATWDDAIGDVQAGYGPDRGWTGGAVQLACGDYGPARIHMRMFELGGFTVANAHFEILIPGTTDHQVLSWELAEQFLLLDFQRAGLLDPVTPMIPTGGINQPDFRTIPAQIYNLLPIELRAAIGGPLGDVTADVPIRSDGNAMILNLAQRVPAQTGQRVQDFVIHFDQTIPKPFCSDGPLDYLYVSGEVHLYQVSEILLDGTYRSWFEASADLQAVPVNPLSGEIIGEPMQARVAEHHASMYSNRRTVARSWLSQRLLPRTNPHAGIYLKRIRVGDSHDGFMEVERCSDGAPLVDVGLDRSREFTIDMI